MTSRASHRPRSNGSRGAALALALLTPAALLCPCAPAAAEPVVTETDDGVVDWTRRTVEAIGVGTPDIISPTGALTPREPYDVAREDAEKRITRLLARLPVDGERRLRDLDPLDARRAAVAKAHVAAETRHFSDGTVHLPASASFAWAAAEWPADPAAKIDVPVGPPLPGPSGLIVKLGAPMKPAVRLRLTTPAGATLAAGTVHDPLGPTGAVFAYAEADVDLPALVGDAPLIVEAAPGEGRGAITLPDEALVGQRIPGAIVILLPEPKR